MKHVDLSRITQILTYKRPHGSTGVLDLIEDIFAGYPWRVLKDPEDQDLALVITVGNSKTLFSCHLDTVHCTPGEQVVMWDEEISLFYKEESAAHQLGEPLGADNGAGIWLLLNMIDADVPGTYLFHFGEEVGGVGSRGMALHHSKFLGKFDRAIAFDRMSTGSVITHQAMGRCCSDEFGGALADALNCAQRSFTYRLDDGGKFTDTANYIDLIGECTNVSCGYDMEHTPNEILDMEHLTMLRQACIEIDWEALPTVRVPGEVYGAEMFNGWNTYRSDYPPLGNPMDDLMGAEYLEVENWVYDNIKDPESITSVLWELLRTRDGDNHYWEQHV